jgi:hypothetical protein
LERPELGLTLVFKNHKGIPYQKWQNAKYMSSQHSSIKMRKQALDSETICNGERQSPYVIFIVEYQESTLKIYKMLKTEEEINVK